MFTLVFLQKHKIVSKRVWLFSTNATWWSIIYLVIMRSEARCCTCHCSGDVSYTNSLQMSDTIVAVLLFALSRWQLLFLPLFTIIYADTPKCDRKWSLGSQLSTKRSLGGLVVFPAFLCLCDSGIPPKMWSQNWLSNNIWLSTMVQSALRNSLSREDGHFVVSPRSCLEYVLGGSSRVRTSYRVHVNVGRPRISHIRTRACILSRHSLTHGNIPQL